MRFLLGRSLLYLSDRCFLHRNTAIPVASEFYDNIIIADIDYNSIKTAGRKNGIPYLHLRNHGLNSLLFFLLWPYKDKPETAKDYCIYYNQ